MNKKGVTITIIVLLGIIALSVTGFLIYALTGDRDFNFLEGSSEMILEKEFMETEVNQINISALSANVKVESGNNEKIEVIIYGKPNDNPTVTINNRTLDIIDEKRFFCIGFCFAKKEIVVKIPNDFKKDIKISTASGNTIIDDILANLNVDTKSGNIKVGNFQDAKLKTMSGNIKAGSGINGDLSTVSGNIHATKLEKASLKTTSGNIEIEEILTSCDISSISGQIEATTINILENSKMSSTTGNIKITNTNELYFETSTTTGKVTINRNERNAKSVLKLSTISGNITVKN